MCMGIGACHAVDWLIAPVIETNVKVLQKSTTPKDSSVDYFHVSPLLHQKVSYYINWFHYILSEFTRLNKQEQIENSEFLL